jgi:preprotein translocase subunit SecE
VQRLTIVVAVFVLFALATWGVDEILQSLAGFFNWIKPNFCYGR